MHSVLRHAAEVRRGARLGRHWESHPQGVTHTRHEALVCRSGMTAAYDLGSEPTLCAFSPRLAQLPVPAGDLSILRHPRVDLARKTPVGLVRRI